MPTYNVTLIGGRPSVTISSGQVVGLSANSLVGYDELLNVYIISGNKVINTPYTNISVNGVPTTSYTDAVFQINTLICTGVNQTGSSGSGGSVTPVTRTNTFTQSTTSGSIPTDTVLVSIYNIGVSNGTVLGTTLSPGESVSFPSTYGSLNGTITYDATGTTFKIAVTR